MNPPTIDGKRLIDSLALMAQVGATEKGGVRRIAATDEDREGRDLLVTWAKREGCKIAIDQIGNLFCRLAGQSNGLDPVLIGSHLDSQPTGGKYDGAYGVLAALETIRALNQNKIRTLRPIELVSWTNEEGSRFAPAMMGSGVFAGALTLSEALDSQDTRGLTLGNSLASIGYNGTTPCGDRTIYAYFEAHIEQGPILESEHKTIGVVEGIQGIRWFNCTLKGTEAHAGSTPMSARRDALIGAANFIGRINKIAMEHAPDGRATVGEFQLYPNSRNVIPGWVHFTVDMRHPASEILSEMAVGMATTFKAVCAGSGLEGKLEEIWYSPPTSFDSVCVDLVERTAHSRGYTSQRITSGAGHDAKYMADICPTAMIFIPCKDGLSHNELEDAKDDHLIAGGQVLLDAAFEKAMEPE